MTTYHATLRSKNAKTGDMPVTTTSADTCPPACPFNHKNQGGCYADSGPLKLHWDKVTRGERGGPLETLCDTIANLPDGQVWRHNQAGDLPGIGDTIDLHALGQLVKANKGKRGFTYTHKPMDIHANETAVENANLEGFTINLSGNNLEHADELADLDIAPVVVVLPSDTQGKTVTTPAGRTVTVCPATYRDDVSCATCKLCAVRDRKVMVGFPAHGTSKRKADAVATS